MTKIINMTPHDIVVLDGSNIVFDKASRSYKLNGEPVIAKTYPTSGAIMRCTQTESDAGNVDGVNLYSVTFGTVEVVSKDGTVTVFDTPLETGVYYIVSSIVKNALLPYRSLDLLVPTHMVRNDKGQPIGCLGFAV